MLVLSAFHRTLIPSSGVFGFCDEHESALPTHGTITYLEDETGQADILIAARKVRGLADAICK